MNTAKRGHAEQVPELVAVWLGLLLPPIAWSMQMVARYALQSWLCLHGFHWVSDVITGTAVLAALAGGALAWRCRRDRLSARSRQVQEQIHRRVVFMAKLGIGLCVLFVVMIVAQWIPERILSACP